MGERVSAPEGSPLEARLRALVLEEAELSADTAVDRHTLLEEDLDLDSLSRLSLCSLLEQEFGIVMTDEVFDGLRSFGDVCDLVTAHASS